MRLSETIPVPKMRMVQASDPIEDEDEKFSLAVLPFLTFSVLGLVPSSRAKVFRNIKHLWDDFRR